MCDDIFLTAIAQDSHLEHHLDATCSVKVPTKRNPMKTNISCPATGCKFVATNPPEHKKHVTDHGLQLFNCLSCPDYFLSDFALQRHYDRVHSTDVPDFKVRKRPTKEQEKQPPASVVIAKMCKGSAVVKVDASEAKVVKSEKKKEDKIQPAPSTSQEKGPSTSEDPPSASQAGHSGHSPVGRNTRANKKKILRELKCRYCTELQNRKWDVERHEKSCKYSPSYVFNCKVRRCKQMSVGTTDFLAHLRQAHSMEGSHICMSCYLICKSSEDAFQHQCPGNIKHLNTLRARYAKLASDFGIKVPKV